MCVCVCVGGGVSVWMWVRACVCLSVYLSVCLSVLQDLLCLLTRYLEPLKEETFLTSDKVAELFGNITEIVQFQQQFLHSLEQAIELEPDFFTTDDTKLFKVGGRYCALIAASLSERVG